jgi:hypothetical protein
LTAVVREGIVAERLGLSVLWIRPELGDTVSCYTKLAIT